MTPGRILWVDELSDAHLSRAGAKIARLGALRRCGVRVPDGFVVSTDAFEHFLESSGAGQKVDEAMATVDAAPDGIEAASLHAREAIEQAVLSGELQDAIIDAYEELSYRDRDLHVPVAVRSSATGEDAAHVSFAGQFDSYLGVFGPRRLLTTVRRCWASLFTARAVAYRRQIGLHYRSSPMAVGVLKLVPARAAGVAFSIHPVSGSEHRMVIEGSWGWGEAVVQGTVTPDHIEVDKSDGRVLDYKVADKKVVSAFDYAQGLVVEQPMPRRLRSDRILTDEEIGAVVEVLHSIESQYGYPVDVEWVLDRYRRPGEPIVIVQTRPITVRETVPKPEWNPVNYAMKYAFGKGRS